MQKFSIYLAAIVTLTLGASSCTKNDTNQTDAEKKHPIPKNLSLTQRGIYNDNINVAKK